MSVTQQVPDLSRLGKRGGLPMHYQAFGIKPPMKTISEGVNEESKNRPSLSFDEVKDISLNYIDEEAEKQRLLHITPGVGQSMTYARKVEEAKAFFVDSSGEFPMLSASIGIDGENLEQVAQVILNLDYQWSIIGSYIESIRLGAKLLVNEAKTIEEIQNITNSINWEVK